MVKNEVAAVNESFDLVSMYTGMNEEERTILEDEMSDLGDGGVEYRMIKMPSGKVKAFTVEGDNPDDPDQMKELIGVMVFTHNMNAYWEGDFGGENKVPTCSSWDARTGFNPSTGETRDCDRCPENAFKDDGSGIVRKACKNMRRIYLMLDGKPDLYMLVVPPTSLRDVKTQLRRIMSGGTAYTSSVLSFTLTGAVSKGGQDYAKISIKKVGDLTPEQAQLARKIREEIKASYRSVSITADNYVTTNDGPAYTDAGRAAAEGAPFGKGTQQSSFDGFMEIPDGMPEELPFN